MQKEIEKEVIMTNVHASPEYEYLFSHACVSHDVRCVNISFCYFVWQEKKSHC